MNMPAAAAIEQAAALLRAGELIGLPTETVYGLAADALNPDAVRKIFSAKGRPADHPLIVHLPDASSLPEWACDIPDEAFLLAQACWPGPLTLILKKSAAVPVEVTGGQPTVGVRVPNHPVALALLRAFGSGVAAPSANRFGRISPTTAAHVRDELGDRVAMVLDGGPCAIGIESTIVDLSRGQPVILRPGAVSAEDIAAIIGRRTAHRGEITAVANNETSDDTPRVSGSLAAHYAPVTPLLLVAAGELSATLAEHIGKGKNVAVLARHEPSMPQPGVVWSRAPADAAGFAQTLYARLRQLDQSGVDLIIIEAPPDSPQWHALNDRLTRAATGAGISGQK